jgi:hypothetical protein
VKLPSAADLKSDARLALYAFLILCVVCGLWTIRGWVSDPFGFLHHQVAKAKQTAAVATGQAGVATGQTAATSDAALIADKGRARDTITVQIHEANHAAVLQASGAGVRLDPAVIAAANRGLCRYASYAGDPDCAAMRAADPPELPKSR